MKLRKLKIQKQVKTQPISFNSCLLYPFEIPHPPQLREACGYFDSAELLGIWHDDHKVTVSDGIISFTTNNSGWRTYFHHPQILPTMTYINGQGISIYPDENHYGSAEYGFASYQNKICMAKVEVIKEALKGNSDRRPKWVREACPDDFRDEEWMGRYRAYCRDRYCDFPQHEPRCRKATKDMVDWLNNRN